MSRIIPRDKKTLSTVARPVPFSNLASSLTRKKVETTVIPKSGVFRGVTKDTRRNNRITPEEKPDEIIKERLKEIEDQLDKMGIEIPEYKSESESESKSESEPESKSESEPESKSDSEPESKSDSEYSDYYSEAHISEYSDSESHSNL